MSIEKLNLPFQVLSKHRYAIDYRERLNKLSCCCSIEKDFLINIYSESIKRVNEGLKDPLKL